MSAGTPQAMSALARANEVRLARSKVRREITAGKLPVAKALWLECCQSATVGSLLAAQWNWGPRKVASFMFRLGLSPHRRVENLTDRQRGLVADGLSERNAA